MRGFGEAGEFGVEGIGGVERPEGGGGASRRTANCVFVGDDVEEDGRDRPGPKKRSLSLTIENVFARGFSSASVGSKSAVRVRGSGSGAELWRRGARGSRGGKVMISGVSIG